MIASVNFFHLQYLKIFESEENFEWKQVGYSIVP